MSDDDSEAVELTAEELDELEGCDDEGPDD
jgi:hypothetical protein